MRNTRTIGLVLIGAASFWIWTVAYASGFHAIYVAGGSPTAPSRLWFYGVTASLCAAIGLICGAAGALLASRNLFSAWSVFVAGWLGALVLVAFVWAAGVDTLAAQAQSLGLYAYLGGTIVAFGLIARSMRRRA